MEPRDARNQLEEELETQRIATQELVSQLAQRDLKIVASEASRARIMSLCQDLLNEQEAHCQAELELTNALRRMGELQPGVPAIKRAAQVLQCHSITFQAQRTADSQTVNIISGLQADRGDLRKQLIECEFEIARLQLLVSIPMSPQEASADVGHL